MLTTTVHPQKGDGAKPSSRSATDPTMKSDSPKPDREAHFLMTKSSAVSDVFNGRDTIIAIFNFLVEGTPSCRSQLSVLSEVCQKWAEVAHDDMYWRDIMSALLPWSLPGKSDKPTSSRRHLIVEQGKCVTERGFRWMHAGFGRADLKRWGRLSLSIEIFDKVCGTRLYWRLQENLEPISEDYQDGSPPSVNLLTTEGREGEERHISIPKDGHKGLEEAFEAHYLAYAYHPSSLPILCERIFVVSNHNHIPLITWLFYPLANP